MPRTPLVVNLTATQPDTVPFFYGMQEGLFGRAGLDITYQAVASGSVGMVAVLGSAANIAFGNPYSVVAAFAKGAPLQFVAPGSDAAAEAALLFTLPASPIRAAKDLEDRTVAVTGLHDLLAIAIRSFVDGTGGDSTKVRFVELPPSAMIGALQEGRVEAAGLFEPFRSAALGMGLRSIGAPYASIGRGYLVGAWFANRSWLDQHRETALRFADVIRVAGQFANGHYEELIPLIATYSKMAPDVLQRVYRPHFAAAVTPKGIQPLIDVAARYQEIPAAFRAQDIILSRR